ncbi:Cation/H+ exchanger, partial [Paraphysoderma sedebokerense]
MNIISALNATDDTPLPPSQEEELLSSRAILILSSLLVFTIWCSYLIQLRKVTWLHESIIAIIVGCFVGLILRFSTTGKQLQNIIGFDHSYFFNLLLPPIILNSGYELKTADFFNSIGYILTFAFAGTFTSIFVIGLILHLITQIPIFPHAFTLLESLSFGAILSSTDPVTVLAIFSQRNVDAKLYSIIFGESILNDSVAIVMFSTFNAIGPSKSQSLLSLVLIFLGVFMGSLLLGVAIGLVTSLILKYSSFSRYPRLESSLVSIIAYMSYLLANAINLSGIVSLLFTGITLKHYAYSNLSKKSKNITKGMFGVLSLLSENFIFVYLGVTIFAKYEGGFNLLLVLVTFPVILLARYASVFPFAKLLNMISHYRVNRRRGGAPRIASPSEQAIPHNYQMMLWWAGLRGAVSFALSLEVSSPEAAPYIRTTTLVIVILTILIFGGSIPWALKRFKI